VEPEGLREQRPPARASARPLAGRAVGLCNHRQRLDPGRAAEQQQRQQQPTPARTTHATNADWKPSVSASSGSPVPFSATKSSVRDTATVETIAVPIAAPI
jgi:hypothetical protein